MEKLNELDEQWKEQLKTLRYNQKFKSKTEKIEYWNKEAEIYDIRMLQDNRRVQDVINILKQKGVLTKKADVLEIGCGTGLYSVELSKYSNSVTSVDISEAMGEVLNDKIKAFNIDNIKFKLIDWDNVDLDKEGLNNRFDISLSALNPSLNSLVALKKFCNTSRKACVIVTFNANVNNNVRQFMDKLLPVKEFGIHDCYSYFTESILQEMGYKVEVFSTDMHWVKSEPTKEAVQRIIKEYKYLNSEVFEDEIHKYILENSDENGLFHENNNASLNIYYWEV
mgnify:FL=1